MAERLKIRTSNATWVVRSGGAILAESSNALELEENGHEPVIYFPRKDIGMPFLELTSSSTQCPYKGQASYYSIHGKNSAIPDAAWSYETPLKSAGELSGYIAFVTDKVTVERL